MSVKVPTEKNFRRAKSAKPGRKKSGRRPLSWRAVTIVGAGLLVLYSTYRAFDLVLNSATLQVQKVVIQGNVRLSTGEVRTLIDGLRGTSIITADLDTYRARLMESPWVADVGMRRILPSTVESRTTTINLRVSKTTRQLIDTAAAVEGKTRTEFMLESARLHAIDVLLDQRLFVLNDAQHEAFSAALDNPPLPNAALKKLLASKSPWEA